MSAESPTESSSEGTSPPETSSGYCLCVPDPKIPRPRNAFILYRQSQHAEVVKVNPGLPNPEISKIIGEQWQNLSPGEKDKWKAFAEQEKARHSQQFPDYRYRPKRSGKYQSAGATQASTQSANCSKCGGKTMNPPHTPHYPAYDHHPPPVSAPRPPKRPYTEAHIQPRQQSMVQVGPPPYPPPMRYSYQPRHDSVHYGPPPPRAQHGLPRMTLEGPDAKRRRIESPYAPRPSYDHQYYGRERASYPHPDQHARHPVPPSASHRPSQAAPIPIRPVAALQPRRDPSLTLPPLKTGVPPRGSIAAVSQTQKAGVETTIMSYPVLSKLKILHSITPALVAPGPSSPSYEVRGAIIAIEGLDHKQVLDMTNSLAEQLEKEGKFLVRTFHGPDPHEALQSNGRLSAREGGELITTEKYLRLISDWHKVSKDLHHFITHKPTYLEEGEVKDHEMVDAPAQSARKDKLPFERETKKVFSPISAISPGTTEQNNEMNLDTSKRSTQPDISLRMTRSRIPQVAQNQQQETVEAAAPPPPPSTERPQTPPPLSEMDSRMDSVDRATSNLIPIALVPSYQLTTVDACSIALPISDNYDPLTHWRWHATIWRGCIGPDVSVIIRSGNELTDEDDPKKQETAAQEHRRTGSVAVTGPRPSDQPPKSGAPPASAAAPAPSSSTSAPTPFGVDVRLQDHRAVIVRAAPPRGSGGADGAIDKEIEKENENWEKAKRRVGFEVEEWMRR
ncbi:slightly ste11-like protein [Lithohypha guttulata]|nr:slightly ste11-like protein [Lithohypha guttulata]